MEHTLNITVRTHPETDTFDVIVEEPECCDVMELNGISYKAKDRDEFDFKVGREIYSWVALWMDAEWEPEEEIEEE